MPYDTVSYKKDGAIYTLSLDREGAGNAVNLRVAEEVAAVCTDISGDASVRVVIITGAGEKAFCAGIDPKEFASQADPESGVGMPSVAAAVSGLAVPVIAALNGDAIGLGLELALACDLRIAAETAHFALDHVTRGMIPWDGATQRLPRVVGKMKAMEMLLTGQLIDAPEAYRIGLITKIVSQKQLMPAATEIALALSLKAPFAVRYAKEAICKGLDLTLDQGLHLEADLYLLLHTTEDRTEGIRALLERRTPQFKGK